MIPSPVRSVRRFSSLVLLALVVPFGPAMAQSRADGDPAAALRTFVADAMPEWETTGLALAVVADGELVLAEGFGVRSVATGEKVDPDTLFAIGSTTKAMTAALVGKLVTDGKLAWDDPVIEHRPDFRLHDPWATRETTVRDLFLHRAGLGNADLLWYGSDRSFEAIFGALDELEPAYSFRDGFVYQNLMYAVAGELAADGAGVPWNRLIDRWLFTPLGMDRTAATLEEAASRGNVATPHDRVGGEIVPIQNEPVDAVSPAGSVWSSAREMARWVAMLLAEGAHEGNEVLSPALVREMFRPQTIVPREAYYPTARLTEPHWTTYGLGWFQQDYRGRMVQFHTGSIDGMAAIVGLVPDAGFGLVVLQNLDHSELRHAILWKAIDLFVFGDPGRDWNAETLALYEELRKESESARAQAEADRREGTEPTLPIERFAGRYEHPVYGVVEIRENEDGLALAHEARWRGRLEHWHHDTFRVVWERPWWQPSLVTFHLGPDAEPAELEILGEEFARLPEPKESPSSPEDTQGDAR